jgi:glutamyl-tRNA synthetase
VPSHHGQVCVLGLPPRLEITVPFPLHGEHTGRSAGAVGSVGSGTSASVLTAASLTASFARVLPSHDGRFAPSPTGDLHLGNLRTALLAWLLARSRGARFLLRVEDLDAGRVREGAQARQLADLRRLGLDWDGPTVRQSQRGPLYAEALARLEGEDLVYPCWCTRAEIRAAASAPHDDDRREGAYPGTCRELPPGARRVHARSGRPAALRVRAGGARVAFADRVAGPHEGRVDDFVLRRNDGAFAYNLAVAVDDADQQIGEVVRGADLLSSTPRQLWLLERLGLPAPGFAHVPLMLGSDGRRLSKRNGALSLTQRLERGGTVQGVVGELAASAGIVPAGAGAMTPSELVAGFDPRLLGVAPPR